MIVYVAGPMTGLPEYNYPAFNAAAEHLTAAGHRVLNPARHGLVDGWTWQDYMRAALIDVATAEGVALLPWWQTSKGARLERHVTTTLDLDVRPIAEWLR